MRFLRLPWRSSSRIRHELEEELGFYFDMRARDLVEQGMSQEAARREAVREFGDVDGTRRYCIAEDEMGMREERRSQLVAELRQDLTHAWRTLRGSPGFVAVTLVTLALGIGANTAIFTVVSGVLSRGIPYRDPERLVRVATVTAHSEFGSLSAADLLDYRARQRSLEGIGALAWGGFNYVGEGNPERFDAQAVSANLFELFGTPAALGRTFARGEDEPGAGAVAVLSDATWRRVFGADHTVIGRSISLDGQPHEVIGVMPPGFITPGGPADIYVPLDMGDMLRDPATARRARWLPAFGRLRAGVTLDAASRDLRSISRQLEREHPGSHAGLAAQVNPLTDVMLGRVRPRLLMLMGAAGFVLLIACANVAGVVLSRTVTRQRELAIRVALGAGRGRLVRQLLTESVVLATVGGGLGLALANLGTGWLVAAGARSLPVSDTISVDGRVLLFTLAVSVLTGLAFGTAPALAASRATVHDVLSDSSRSSTGGVGRFRVRQGLVVAQMALAVMLLVGAGLLVKSFVRLRRVELGFDRSGALTFYLSPPLAKYGSPERVANFFDAVEQRMRGVTGVEAVARVAHLPIGGGSAGGPIAVAGRTDAGTVPPNVGYQVVSQGYFGAMRIPLLAGRAFDDRDRTGGSPVVLVSERLARTIWPEGGAVGASVRLGLKESDPWRQVIGVVGDVRQNGAIGDSRPTVYTPARQSPSVFSFFVVRATSNPSRLKSQIRAEVRELDPELPVTRLLTMDEIVGESLAGRKLPALLMGSFAGLALILTSVGLYAVMAHAVVARTREFGIRMALGAGARSVLGMVLRQGALTALAGLTIGLGGAAALARFLGSQLFEVRPLDVSTFVVVSVVLLAVTLVALLVPAWRATRVDPVIALRVEG